MNMKIIKKDKSAVAQEPKEVERKESPWDDVRYYFMMYYTRPDSTVWRLIQGGLAECRAELVGPLYPFSEVVSVIMHQKCNNSALDGFYVTDALDLAYKGKVLSIEELQNRLSRINEMLCQIAKTKVSEVYYLESSVEFDAKNDATKALTDGRTIKICTRRVPYIFSISFEDESCSVSIELSRFMRRRKAYGIIDPYPVRTFGVTDTIKQHDKCLDTFGITNSRELVYKGAELEESCLMDSLQMVYDYMCHVTKQIAANNKTKYVGSAMMLKAANDAAESFIGKSLLVFDELHVLSKDIYDFDSVSEE